MKPAFSNEDDWANRDPSEVAVQEILARGMELAAQAVEERWGGVGTWDSREAARVIRARALEVLWKDA